MLIDRCSAACSMFCRWQTDVTKAGNGERFLTFIDVEMPHLSYMETGLCRFNV